MTNDRQKITIAKNKKDYAFYINNTMRNKSEYIYGNNTIKTTKYNVFTFLPKALLFQFMRLANVYFLVTAIINCIKIISPLGSEIGLIPILFVLCVSLIRELIEDIFRYQMDKKQNEEPTELYSSSTCQWQNVKTGQLQIGEIVKVKQDETFPSDLILIDSNLSEGICYIETASLDGEKSLKIKTSSIQTVGFITPSSKNISINGEVMCDHPNPYLNFLNGKMKIEINKKIIEIPLTEKQLLLKGAQLRNTQWVIGVVCYTGNNCKIMLNSKKPRMKYSKVENLMNKLLIGLFFFECLICIFCSIMHKVYYNNNLKNNPYLSKMDVETIEIDSVINFFSHFLLFDTMIPISLIITLEFVKIIQGIFLYLDADSYSKIRKKHLQPHSINLNEELGMIDYIFTDKTGTLTCNKMQFKFCVIGDTCFEYVPFLDYCEKKEEQKNDEKIKENKNNNNSNNSSNNNNMNNNVYINNYVEYDNEIIKFTNYEMIDYTTIDDKKETKKQSGKSYASTLSSSDNKNKPIIHDSRKNIIIVNTTFNIIEEFWKCLSLCHDCSIDGEGINEEYVGLSPDSIELVRAARSQGFKYTKNPNNKRSIRRIEFGRETTEFKDIEKLQLFEFTSDRKRESIIVKEDKIIKLYIKGADNVIEQRLSSNSPKIFLSQSQKYVDYFSALGYRTLFVGMKVISQDEYNTIANEIEKANYEMINKEEKLNEIYSNIEKDILLLGATIVEDKLQDKVAETIRDLKFAGIKFWMLTGDKMTTAYNIALSCNLLSKNMKLFRIEGKEIIRDAKLQITNQSDIEKVIITFAKEYNNFKGEYSNIKEIPQFGILIDEKALHTVCYNEEMKKIFLNIAQDAVSVVCCRVSPLQKSQVVKLVKEFAPNKITLAIGDGGNDVSMIMEAHIGIGIYGEEGMRAVQSSDYAIGEFKFLRQLTLFHGRTNYIRISELILFFFYKNFLFTMEHFYFCFYCNFSAQTIIDDWFISMYNLLFTAFPVGARACIDFDVRPDDGIIINKMLPFLYMETRDFPIFRVTTFVLTLIKGGLQGIIHFFFIVYSIYHSPINDIGDIGDIWFASVTMYTGILIIVSFNMVINTRFHTWINHVIMATLTFICYGIFLVIAHYWKMFKSRGTIRKAFESGMFYMDLLIVGVTCAIVDLFWRGVYTNFSNRMSMYLEKVVNRYRVVNDVKHIHNREVLKKLEMYEE